MKKQHLLKSTLCLLMAMVCNAVWAQTATLGVSTSVDSPESLFEMKSGAGHWMTSYTSPTQTMPGKFAFFAVTDKENAYQVYSVDRKQWVSYTVADSYSYGTKKAVLVESQDDAQPWNITKVTVSEVGYYQFAPYKADGTVASIYMNWYNGTGSNPYDNTTTTVGFWTSGASGDSGSRWTLATVAIATNDVVDAAKALIKTGVGYPLTTSAAYTALNGLAYGASENAVNTAKNAYISCSDILLPEDGKAYTFANHSQYATQPNRYLNYTTGSALSMKTAESDASVFVCHKLSEGVYVFITEDGKILTWMGGKDGYLTDGTRYGYSANYPAEQSGYSDWNEITIAKHTVDNVNSYSGTNADFFGMLHMTARRKSDGFSSFIVKGSNGGWDQAGTTKYYQSSGSYCSSAWYITEVEHTNTDAQTLALAKIEAKATVAANAPGTAVCQYHYIVNGEDVYDAATLNTAIDAATTADEVNALTASYSINLPETGKYYRIKGISGNYIDAVNCYSGDQMGMKSADKCNYEGSIFYLDDNKRLKNIATGTYVYDTRRIGATESNGNTWTFAEYTKTDLKGYLTLTSSYSSAAYLHDNSGNRADRCNNICGDRHAWQLEEVAVAAVLTVDGPGKVDATATWNEETKTIPATWIVLEGQTLTVTDATLSVTCNDVNYTFSGLQEGDGELVETMEIEELTADRTITAKFSPAFLSTTYGEKWVRLQNCSNTSYWATLESTAANGSGKTATLDYADEKQLWCLVGTAESFVLYNKAAGEELALNVPLADNATGYANGNLAQLTADKGTWKLIEQDFGYALAPTVKSAGNTLGINMYEGAGGYLKLYATGSSNTGSYWTVQQVDAENTLSLSVTVDKVWESSPRVAELTTTFAGISSTTRILGNVESQKMYLPKGATFSLSSMTYRGYTFNGFSGADSYTDATLPEGGLEITASYTANDGRTLFYSLRDGHPYRIPAIATAPNGDIFAICDYRPCNQDIGYGEVDLVCRISSDNGVTWTDEYCFADGQGDAYAANDTSKIWQVGFGDPAIVADRERNEVLVMSVCGNQTCWDGTFGETDPNPNRMARVRITYDEATKQWVYSDPVEVTYDIYPKFVDSDGNVHAASMFIGAGKICQSRVVKKGDYYRLYCSVWTVTKTQRQHHNYVIYSDDFGETWNVLGDLGYDNCPSKYGNEPKCEELPDGTVVLSSRKYYGRYFNLFKFDDNTYTTGSWLGEVSSNDIEGGLSFGNNSTNGEIYKVKAIHKESGRICDLMFQSIPTGNGRSDVAVYYKEMEYNEDGTNKYTLTTFAQGWTKGKHVSIKGSCYSTMILQADGRIAFFFEEEPSGYCMVYIPYTIEDLTGDAYSLYTVESTISEHGIGTFYASEAMAIPEGVTAYVATEDPVMNGDAGYIQMTELEGIIPANTGAVIRGEADTYKFIPSISYGTAVEGNMLVGYEAADNKAGSYSEVSLAEEYTTYVLAAENGKAGFYRKEVTDEKSTFYVYNNKAYLNVPATQGVRSLAIRFGDETTSIDNSQLTIDNSQLIYDLQGRRVVNPAKGVYIVNGKKVVIR